MKRGTGSRRGAALVEFALTALVVYLLVAGGVELGRMIFISQVLQDAARLAARELSVTPIPAITNPEDPMTVHPTTFEEALKFQDANDPHQVDVPRQVWDPNRLVIDLSCNPTADQLADYLKNLPIVNRALWTVYITETTNLGDGPRRIMRYPGAILKDNASTSPPDPAGSCPNALTDFTVWIPRVLGRDTEGRETIDWVPVLAEVRRETAPPGTTPEECGPFPVSAPAACVTDPNQPTPRGIVAVAVNYPFQSAALSGFRRTPPTAEDPFPPNFGNVIAADDLGVTAAALPSGTEFADPQLPPPNALTVAGSNVYSGRYGLGSQFALSTLSPTQQVRPYRSLLLGQAMFRREVIQ